MIKERTGLKDGLNFIFKKYSKALKVSLNLSITCKGFKIEFKIQIGFLSVYLQETLIICYTETMIGKIETKKFYDIAYIGIKVKTSLSSK